MKQPPFDRRGVFLLGMGHLFNDINQGAIPALLPFFVAQRGFSYLDVSGVILAATAISSIAQPLLGYISDRRPIPWLLPAGMVAGGLGVALSGITENYWIMLAFILITGIGVSAFHPEGFRYANYTAHQSAAGMSIFTVGGSLGFALGPLVITAAVVAFGMRGTLVMIVPALIYALVLWRELPRLNTFRPKVSDRGIKSGGATLWVPLFLVALIILLRSMMSYGVQAFAPLYLIDERDMPIATANTALTVFSLASAAGTLTSGYISDHLGHKLMLVVSALVMTPLIAGFFFLSGGVAIFFLGLVGFASGAGAVLVIVMGQDYAGANIGVATGIITGTAIGLGGMLNPIFGGIADHYGIPMVFYILLFVPLLYAALALILPGTRQRTGSAPKVEAPAPAAAQPVALALEEEEAAR